MHNCLIKPILIFLALCLVAVTIIFNLYIIVFYVCLALIVVCALWLIVGFIFEWIEF